jgi:hypothetical protein
MCRGPAVTQEVIEVAAFLDLKVKRSVRGRARDDGHVRQKSDEEGGGTG